MIHIYIPFVNRPDLLKKAVDSVPVISGWRDWQLNYHLQVEVINNSGKPLPDDINARESNPPVPLTFAQSQNWMLRVSEDFLEPFYIFMHSDAEAGEGTVQKLIELAWSLTNEGRKWGVIMTNYDALAAFNTAAFREVGGWDVHLPWYFADNSMYRKLRLAGYELIESNLPVKHEPSQTIKSDPFLNHVNGITFPIYAEYYRQCWGGSPGNETFTVPFNGVFA
jgi:hypothetical protein